MSDRSVFVSAVIPTYNRAHVLPRALGSLFSQSVPVDEVIIVDDGSTDGTADMLRSTYGERVRVIVQPNGGVSAARLAGIRAARGEWISFLDSDDEWAAERNFHLVKAAESVPADVGWVFGDIVPVEDGGDSQSYFEKFGLRVTSPLQIFGDSFAVQYPVQYGMLGASLIRRTALLQLHCFEERLRSSEDLLVGFQVASRYRFAAVPALALKLYRTSDLRLTSTEIAGVFSNDYYRARLLGAELAIQAKAPGAWASVYAQAARGLCLARPEPSSNTVRSLASKQLWYEPSLKSAAFWCAGLLGTRGMSLWLALKATYRRTAAVRA